MLCLAVPNRIVEIQYIVLMLKAWYAAVLVGENYPKHCSETICSLLLHSRCLYDKTPHLREFYHCLKCMQEYYTWDVNNINEWPHSCFSTAVLLGEMNQFSPVQLK